MLSQRFVLVLLPNKSHGIISSQKFNDQMNGSFQLDLKIRLCIRDSLFRLAQSATKRQSGNDSCGTKKAGREVSKEEINTDNRFVPKY